MFPDPTARTAFHPQGGNAVLSSMDPKIRLLLSAMLFFLVTIFGFVCLLLTGKMVP